MQLTASHCRLSQMAAVAWSSSRATAAMSRSAAIMASTSSCRTSSLPGRAAGVTMAVAPRDDACTCSENGDPPLRRLLSTIVALSN